MKIHECRYVQEKTFRLDVYRKIELIDDSEETVSLECNDKTIDIFVKIYLN